MYLASCETFLLVSVKIQEAVKKNEYIVFPFTMKAGNIVPTLVAWQYPHVAKSDKLCDAMMSSLLILD